MKVDKIHHLYFFLASLFFVLALNATFYYFYKTSSQGGTQGNNKLHEQFNNKSADSVNLNNNVREDAGVIDQTLILPAISDSDYVLGDRDASIEMIIYDDPTGAFSPEYFPRVETLRSEFAGDIKIALRLLPLNIDKYSRESCLAVICAGEQGKYFESYKKLLQANTDKAINKEYLSDLANALDLDDKKFQACLSGEMASKKLADWTKEAENYYIIGAPNTFINNRPYPGDYQLDDFTDSAGYKREGLRTVISQLRIKS